MSILRPFSEYPHPGDLNILSFVPLPQASWMISLRIVVVIDDQWSLSKLIDSDVTHGYVLSLKLSFN